LEGFFGNRGDKPPRGLCLRLEPVGQRKPTASLWKLWPRAWGLWWALGFGLWLGAFVGPSLTQAIELKTDFKTLQEEVSYLRDPSGLLTLSEVTQRTDFRPLESGGQDFGFDLATFWVRFPLANLETNPRMLYLGLNHPSLDFVDLYLLGPAGEISHFAQGDHVAHRLWSTSARVPTFTLDLPGASQNWVYLKVASQAAVQLPLTLRTAPNFTQAVQTQTLWYGLFFGVLVVMGLFNLALWLPIREKAYPYYVVTLSGFALATLSYSGVGYQYLWGDSVYWADRATPLGILLAHCGGFLFAHEFMGLSRIAPRTAKLVLSLSGVAGLLVVLGLFAPARPLLLGVLVATVPAVGVIFWTGVLACRSGLRSAWFYMASWALAGGGVVVLILKTFLVIPEHPLFQGSLYSGILANLFLLSLGLLDRVRQLRTEKNQAQKEVWEAEALALEHLKASDQLKTEFLANTSEELLHPLDLIISHCELLLQDEQEPKSAQLNQGLSLVYTQANRLFHLVANILDFVQLKQHHLKLNLQPVYLHKAVDFVFLLHKPLLLNRELRLVNQVSPELRPVLADAQRLHQMLFNLIENAVSYTQKGSVTVKGTESGTRIRIEVQDTGPGMTLEELARLKEPLERGQTGQKSGKPGVGLGLALVERLAALHEGSFGVTSSRGEGTCAYLELPVAPPGQWPLEAAVPAFPQTALGHPVQPGESELGLEVGTVLLVEDEPLVGELLVRILKGNGYLVHWVTRGQEALERLKEEPGIDLVLLDVMLPGLDGFELCRLIRKEKSALSLPVLFLTARVQSEDLVQGFNIGANDYIYKPVRKAELLARVESQVQAKRAVEALRQNRLLQREIERRIRMEDLLRSLRTRLVRILDGLPLPFLVFNAQGQVTFVNKQAESVCSVSLETTKDLRFEDLVVSVGWAEFSQDPGRTLWVHTRTEEAISGHGVKIPAADESEVLLILMLQGQDLEFGLRQKTLEATIRNTTQLLSAEDLVRVNETRILPERLDHLQDGVNPPDRGDLNQLAAEVMNLCIGAWAGATGKDKLALAEESGIWTVTAETTGTYRTRTLDRYLKVNSLPKNPRWRNVLQTGYFVRQFLAPDSPHGQQLEGLLVRLEGLLIHL